MTVRISIKMKRILGLMMMCILLAVMPAGCSASEENAGEGTSLPESAQSSENDEEVMTEMKMTISDTPVQVAWEDNESVKALARMAENGPVKIEMEPYGGFEQVGPIGETLPSSDTDIMTGAGDIMLYSGSQMVIFYGSNSWDYTRLGKITDKSDAELRELLGGGGVTVTVTVE